MNIISYKGYQAKIEYDDESGTLLGTVLNLSDVVTFQSKETATVKDEFEAAVDDYLDTCEAIGKNPEKPFSGTFNIRVGEALHRKLSTEALLKNTSLNDLVKECLEKSLETPSSRPSGEMSVTINLYESKDQSRSTDSIGEVTKYESIAVGTQQQPRPIRTHQGKTTH